MYEVKRIIKTEPHIEDVMVAAGLSLYPALYLAENAYNEDAVNERNEAALLYLSECNETTKEYQLQLLMGLVQYYFDKDEIAKLDELMLRIDPADLSVEMREQCIHIIIARGMYDRALDWVETYGTEYIDDKIQKADQEAELLKQINEEGINPYFHELESRQDTEVIMEGKRRIMLGSNNYLGLTVEPAIIEAGIRAFEKYGTGCSGSRFLNGTLEMHLELEAELAEFVHKEEAVTFSTGFQSNLGIISALVSRGDYVICDRENHASIYDGCKLSYGKMLRYRHADMENLENLLKSVSEENAGILIVTDGGEYSGIPRKSSAEILFVLDMYNP